MGGFIRKYIKKKPKAIQELRKKAVEEAPSGPTAAELEQKRLSRIKRRGRKSTKLGVEDEDIFLSIKTLLG
tara:strand:- start:55 stop:267 length:213 start_codon:yes stop_codon:yes gene_type:complete